MENTRVFSLIDSSNQLLPPFKLLEMRQRAARILTKIFRTRRCKLKVQVKLKVSESKTASAKEIATESNKYKNY
jgi:hypothetical protein